MTKSRKPAVLVLSDAYLPGYKSGGPIRTLANMVEQLGDEFAFLIATRNREIHGSVPYPNCPTATWRNLGKAKVIYFSPRQWTLPMARRVVKDAKCDIIYLNSVFSTDYTICPLLLRVSHRIPPAPIILAPRGELSPGALRIKRIKKAAFLQLMLRFGLYRNVRWQATTVEEEADIRRWFGEKALISIAPNLRSCHDGAVRVPAARKQSGEASIVFLSRISRMKNLDGALRLLAGVRGRVAFHIYGPEEDAAYWDECTRIIAALPNNIRVEYHGAVQNDKVPETLAAHDLFLLPTLGENFGHVLLEALLAGLPVVTSDRTPWRELTAKRVGFDLPLERPDAFQAAIQQFVDMDEARYRQWSESARRYGRQVATDPSVVEANRKLFLTVLAESATGRQPLGRSSPAFRSAGLRGGDLEKESHRGLPIATVELQGPKDSSLHADVRSPQDLGEGSRATPHAA
jgi:glycosyltransferase involved in cell wall biosynthesis